MEARLYADEQFPVRVAHILSGYGHDIKFVRQEQSTDKSGSGTTDAEVLDYAWRHKRIVLTLNAKHFGALHADMHWHYGILCCDAELDKELLAKLIDRRLKRGRMKGKCEWIGKPPPRKRRKS